MDNGIYVTLTRELALFRDMDVSANNIANANTTGYNSEHMLFNTYLARDINHGQKNPLHFSHNPTSYRNTENGPISITGNDLDVAISGEGYFIVDTPLGERYTRAGNFHIDNSSVLVSAEGYPVVDSTGQHITFPDNVRSVQVGEAGNLKVNNEDFGYIAVVQFASPQLLERVGSTLFKADATPQPADNFKVAQGSLEGSNVNSVKELTHMVKLSHDVAGSAKLVETMYDLERKAANAWAKQS